MGGDHHGRLGLGGRLHERLQELAAGQRVEAGDRLVQQQQLGSLGQRQGERDLGALAARQRADRPVSGDGKLAQPVGGESAVKAWVELAAKPQQLGGGEVPIQGHVLGDKADPGQVLGSVLVRGAQHPDAAAAGLQQADGQVEQGGLAGTVGAHQGPDPTGGQGEGAVLQRPVAPRGSPVGFGQAGGLQSGAHAHAMSSDARSCEADADAAAAAVADAAADARKVVWNRARMLSSSSPACRALVSQAARRRRRAAWLAGGVLARLRVTKVPSPGRPATRPSCSSCR